MLKVLQDSKAPEFGDMFSPVEHSSEVLLLYDNFVGGKHYSSIATDCFYLLKTNESGQDFLLSSTESQQCKTTKQYCEKYLTNY